MATTTNLSTLKINYLTQDQYNNAVTSNTVDPNELYLTPSSVIVTSNYGTAAPTSSTPQNGMGSLYFQTIEKADWVVEEGTDGIWTYRKWASGIAECWGNRGTTSYAMTQTSGTGYYTSFTQTLPAGLFTSITCGITNRCGGTTGNGLIVTDISTINTTQFTCFIWCTVSITYNVDVSFNIKGRWK